MMRKLFVIVSTIASLSIAHAGNVFYWRTQYIDNHTEIGGASQDFFAWADFGDPANWSLSPSSYVNPEGLVPGKDDFCGVKAMVGNGKKVDLGRISPNWLGCDPVRG